MLPRSVCCAFGSAVPRWVFRGQETWPSGPSICPCSLLGVRVCPALAGADILELWISAHVRDFTCDVEWLLGLQGFLNAHTCHSAPCGCPERALISPHAVRIMIVTLTCIRAQSKTGVIQCEWSKISANFSLAGWGSLLFYWFSQTSDAVTFGAVHGGTAGTVAPQCRPRSGLENSVRCLTHVRNHCTFQRRHRWTQPAVRP